MGKTAIITDSNSGITQDMAKELGIFVLPMPFYINEKLYFEDITLTQEQFYEFLKTDANISTSQPSPGDVTDLWDKVLEEYDEIVHMPMSSGLSSSYETAAMLAQDYDGKVEVVNNQRISPTQRRAALDALEMAKNGKSAKEIREILERDKFESIIYITVDDLSYLKKGGRLTPAVAAIGTILNLKPILIIEGEKLDAFAKTRGWKAAKKGMLKAIQKDLDVRFHGASIDEFHLDAAYTGDLEDALEWKAEIEAAFPGREVHMDPLSLSVSCHIGPGAKAVTLTRKYRD
jgi:DegV family protein with EDD domain